MKKLALPPAKEVDGKMVRFQILWEQIVYPTMFWRETSKTKLGRLIDEKLEGKEPAAEVELTDGEHEALLQAFQACPPITNPPACRYFNLCLEHVQDAK